MTTPAERIALDYVKNGIFEVDIEGRFWRIAKRLSNGSLAACTRCPAEHRRPKGYLDLPVWRHGRAYYPLAHRVLWAHLHEGEIDGSMEVNHIDLDKSNNRPSNLELVTHQTNRRHAASHRKSGIAKLTIDDVWQIRRLITDGMPINLIARRYSVTPRAITCVRERISYAWLEDSSSISELGKAG